MMKTLFLEGEDLTQNSVHIVKPLEKDFLVVFKLGNWFHSASLTQKKYIWVTSAS